MQVWDGGTIYVSIGLNVYFRGFCSFRGNKRVKMSSEGSGGISVKLCVIKIFLLMVTVLVSREAVLTMVYNEDMCKTHYIPQEA